MTLTLSRSAATSSPRLTPGVALDLEVPPPGAPGPTVPSESTDIVEEWGMQSFPASDPPSNW